jgi:hypothetical protein
MISPNKYRAKATIIDGHRFPSKHEADTYLKLRLLKQAGKIKDFKMQVPLGLRAQTSTGREYRYMVDFMTTELDGSHTWIEAKGMDLPLGKLKRALAEYFYGIKVEVV